MTYAALGSDTGGSIRLPAAACGVTGIKPTQTRVSRAGVMPLSFSLDTVGPLARTARDCARILSVIAGHDSLDPTSSTEKVFCGNKKGAAMLEELQADYFPRNLMALTPLPKIIAHAYGAAESTSRLSRLPPTCGCHALLSDREGYDPSFFLMRFPSRHCWTIQSAVTRVGIGFMTTTRRPVRCPSPSTMLRCLPVCSPSITARRISPSVRLGRLSYRVRAAVQRSNAAALRMT